MKLYEKSPFSGEIGSVSILDRIKGVWRYGLAWDRDLQAQQVFIIHLRNLLDNKFIILRNMILPDLPIPIPLILVGPRGVKVINVSSIKGIFRVKGDKCLSLDAQNKRYIAIRPNLIKQSIRMSQAVQNYLFQCDILVPGVEAVLFFSHPGVHIDPDQPATRIVQRDGIESFVTGILRSPIIMDSTDGQVIAETLLISALDNKKTNLLSEPSKLGAKARSTIQHGLESWQWIVIGILFIIALAVVIELAYIFLTAD